MDVSVGLREAVSGKWNGEGDTGRSKTVVWGAPPPVITGPREGLGACRMISGTQRGPAGLRIRTAERRGGFRK